MIPHMPSESFRRPGLAEGGVDPDRIVVSAKQVNSYGVRMPQPDVRDAPDAGAIHWHEQIEPGIPHSQAYTASGPDSGPIESR